MKSRLLKVWRTEKISFSSDLEINDLFDYMRKYRTSLYTKSKATIVLDNYYLDILVKSNFDIEVQPVSFYLNLPSYTKIVNMKGKLVKDEMKTKIITEIAVNSNLKLLFFPFIFFMTISLVTKPISLIDIFSTIVVILTLLAILLCIFKYNKDKLIRNFIAIFNLTMVNET